MIKVQEEITVYVIEYEQPWINWHGVLHSYDFGKDICLVENHKEELIELPLKRVQEADTNEPIKDFIIKLSRKTEIIKFLAESNLSLQEANLFYNLSLKIKPSNKHITDFYFESFQKDIDIKSVIIALTESLN